MTTETAGAKAFAFVTDALASGLTVYVSTYTRHTKITPKTAASWAKSGHILFKLSAAGDLLMARGRSFVTLTSGAINLVHFTARAEGR